MLPSPELNPNISVTPLSSRRGLALSFACDSYASDHQKTMKGKRLGFVASLVLLFPVLALAEEQIKFPVAASSKVLGYAPLWVASGMGFLKREGLDAEVTA